MTGPQDQTQNIPTQRLLELIRSKGQNRQEPPESSDPLQPASNAVGRRLRPAKNMTRIGVEIADGRICIAGTASGKGQSRLFLWKMADYGSDPQTEQGARELKKILSTALTQNGKPPGQNIEFWASWEFSREDVHLLTLPMMKKKDIPAALNWHLKRRVDVDLAASVLDFEILGQVTEGNVSKYQILAVLVPQKEVTGLQQAFARAGYPLSGITPAALADLNLFRSSCLSPAVPNIALMHIGAHTSRIVIARHQHLYLQRRIRTGSKTLLEDLPAPEPESSEEGPDSEGTDPETLLQTLLQSQEQGSAQSADAGQETGHLQAAIEPGVDRLIRQVERTLSYYTRNLGFDPVQRLYLSGRLAAIPDVQSQFARTLDLEVKPLDGFAGNLGQTAPQPSSPAQRLSLGTALGLSLSRPDQTLNFLRTFAQKARDRTMLRTRLAAIAAVTVLLGVLAGFHLWQQVHIAAREGALQEAAQRAEQLDTRITALQKQISTLEPDGKSRSRSQLLRLVQAKYSYWREYADRFQPLAYLSEIFARLPDQARIEKVFAYLQDAGPGVALSLESTSDSSPDRVLYSDPGAGITLRQPGREQAPESGSFDTLIVVKGMLSASGRTRHLVLDQLTRRLNASPLFQVWDSLGQEHVSPSVGPAIEFHVLLTVV
ncbi:hypothetical protein [Desulfovermiculus halophilus]|uniref:hypothetical protein n=1 Tax=Desulfovermiculus halophilus TaxID=339722 RepID=UPI000487F2B0|nr:hypothetical protein [Desulfovermiculus halophilus]